MKYYLIKYNAISDEDYSVSGFIALGESEKSYKINRIKRAFKHGGEFFLNDSTTISYSDISNVMSDIKITEISKTQFQNICSMFPQGKFGTLGVLGDEGYCDECGCLVDDFGVNTCTSCEEEEECENCGATLEEWEFEKCDSCKEEEEEEEEDDDDMYEYEYEKQVTSIVNKIESEFNIEKSDSKESDLCFKFFWKPTNNTSVQINIKDYDFSDGSSDVEIKFKKNNKTTFKRFEISESYSNFNNTIKASVNNFLKQSRQL